MNRAQYIERYGEVKYEEYLTKCKQRNKAYYEAHKDERKLKQKAYDEARKDEKLEYNRTYNKTYRKTHQDQEYTRIKRWREDNIDAVKEKRRDYYEANKEKFQEYAKEYNPKYRKTKQGRASYLAAAYKTNDKLKNRGECTLTSQWIMDHIFSGQVCRYCGENDWKVLGCDRIDNNKPHTPDNVVCSCWDCNNKRGEKPYEVFVEECNQQSA